MKADFEKGTKVCSKCRYEKSIGEFDKHSKESDGLRCWCKECCEKYRIKHRTSKRQYKKRPKKVAHFGYKFCTKCEIEKPVGEFVKDKNTKDGLVCWCRDCLHVRSKMFRMSHRKSKRPYFERVKPSTHAGFKICSECRIEKPIDQFGKHKQSGDGLRSQCKSCGIKRHIAVRKSKKPYKARKNLPIPSNPNNKVCYACEMEKPLYQFYRNKNNKDGHSIRCKSCSSTVGKSLYGKYHQYRANAKTRNHAFKLTFDQFSSFWQLPCYYCGDPIETIGLDRIDSSKGYTMDNVRPCCASCNRGKLDFTTEEFIGWIKRVHKRLCEIK